MILLIEDRTERQKLFMRETNIDLDDYNDILDNVIKDKYQKFLQDMEKGTFDLDKYTVIISHKSAFGDDNSIFLQKLEDYCILQEKPFVLFSGGIDTNYYEKTDYELLELNSKLFYSENLKLFLDTAKEKEPNILIMAYGKQWRLNILLNVFEKMNLKIEENTRQFYKDFQLETNYRLLEDLDVELYSPVLEGKDITIDEMKKIGLDLENHIKKVIVDA